MFLNRVYITVSENGCMLTFYNSLHDILERSNFNKQAFPETFSYKTVTDIIQLHAAFTVLSFPISEERLIGSSGSELRWFWEEDERIEGERLAAFSV